MPGAQISYLPDGRRMHLHHGPIDLVVEAWGAGRDAALRRAASRFETVLDELVAELDVLRAPVRAGTALHGDIARAMLSAVRPYAPDFVTPMAAVAGAVADEVLRALVRGGGVNRAYVNNGGDVAVFLAPGERLSAAVAAGHADRVTICGESPVRGIATSGWRGRSHSLGIADAVTVLARNAAAGDAAATLIANAVDLPGHPGITRAPARSLSPDSDLVARLVTVDVAPLSDEETRAALARGAAFAQRALSRGLICAALLTLGPQRRVVGPDSLLPMTSPQTTKDPCHA